jgi:NADH-quinone oxidoreductase subunit N
LLIVGWTPAPVSLFNGMMRADDFSATMRLMFTLGAILTLLIGNGKNSMDYFLMIVSVTLGANLLVMSNNFIMIVIAMELISISSYLLTAGNEPDRQRSEAAWKFFLFGSASTAVMIFGMSYLFGLTGTLNFASTEFLRLAAAGPTPLVIGGLLTLGGFLFKMSAVPFHLWVPDVYESVPASIAAFFSVVPKLAALGIVTKFSLALHLFGQSPVDWALLVAAAAAVSIIVGTVAALAQTDAKRMMAWSSVAQAGFLLAGACTMSIEGVHVTLFYAAVFLIMNYCVFIFIDVMEKTTGSARMDALAGMGRASALPAAMVTLALVSLTGLPPTAGFMGKLLVFSALWEKSNAAQHVMFLGVLGTGLICTVISLFFYLRIPYFLFIKSRPESTNTIKISPFQNLLSIILVTVLLILFFNPGLLMTWLNKVSFVL